MKVHAKMLHKEIKNIIEYDDNESKKIEPASTIPLIISTLLFLFFLYKMEIIELIISNCLSKVGKSVNVNCEYFFCINNFFENINCVISLNLLFSF